MHSFKKGDIFMAKIFDYCVRYLLNLCLIVAVVFTVACAALVVTLAAKGDIRIHKVEDNTENRNDKQ